MSKKREKKKDEAENIKVIVRSRPLNTSELEQGMKSMVDLDLTEGTVTVHHVCGQPDRWTFDAVVNNTYSQSDVFVQFIQPMVDSVLNGFNSTIFAYGQSGSGKTYTMTGGNEHAMGLIPRSFTYIFDHIRERKNPNIAYTINCSYLELYNGRIRDLLAKEQVTLQIKENKDKTFYVHDLSHPEVKLLEDLMGLMSRGAARRQVNATELNQDSSRSHSIFTVSIQMVENMEDGECRTVTSKLNLVDLAGSERQSKTRASGDTLKEGCNINLSLSALGTVIDTIVKGKGHIPFRSSPLTMLLKDSLGGSSKTCMFANINLADANISETVSTLRFADRAKQIKNKPIVQMDAKDQKIQELLNKVQELTDKLKAYESNEAPNLEEENEQLHEKVAMLETEISALKDDLRDAASENKELFTVKQQEIAAVQQQVEERDEAINSLNAEYQVAAQHAGDAKQDILDLKDVLVNFISDALPSAEPPTHDASAADFARLLEEARQMQGGGAGLEQELDTQRLKLESDAATAAAQHKSEMARLEAVAEQSRVEAKDVQEKLAKMKTRLDKEKEQRKALQEKLKAELSEARDNHKHEMSRLKEKMSVVGGVAHDTEGAPKKVSLGAVGSLENLMEAQQDVAMHQEKIKSLEQELARAEAERSKHTDASHDNVERARAAQLAAETEASKLLQRFSEPADGDSEQLLRYKKEIQVLDLNLSSLRKEKAGVVGELEHSKGVAEEHAREIERLEGRVRELESGQLQLKRLAMIVDTSTALADNPGTAKAMEVAELESKIEVLTAECNIRDAALSRERESHRKELEKAELRHKTVEDHRDTLLEVAQAQASGGTGGDGDGAFAAVVSGLRTELRDAQVEVRQLKQMQELLESAQAPQPLASAGAGGSSGDHGDPAALEAEVRRLAAEKQASMQKLQDAHSRVMELESKLAAPADGDSEAVIQLKSELRQLSTNTEHHIEEIAALTKQLEAERGAVRQLKETKKQQKKKIESLKDGTERAARPTSGNLLDVRQTAPSPVESDPTERLAEQLRDLQRDIAAEQEEKKEMSAELERALEEVKTSKAGNAASEQVQRELNEANAAAAKMRDELAKASNATVQEERTAAKWKKERDVAVQAQQRAQQRLTERDASLKQMQELNASQNQILEKHKAHEQLLQKEIDALKEKAAHFDRLLGDRVEQEQAKWAKFNIQKLQECNEQHERASAKKEEEMEALRKKIRKANVSVQKVKERYDSKVLEAEGLRTQLEDMKEVALKRLRKVSDVEESRDEIQKIIRGSRAAGSRAMVDSDDEAEEINRKISKINNKGSYPGDERVSRAKIKSAAARKFDEENDATTAAQQASHAARIRAAGSVVQFTRRSKRWEGEGNGERHGSHSTEEGEVVEGPVPPHSRHPSAVVSPTPPMPPPPPPNQDNDTPGVGIHRQLSPRMQFNPRNRQRDVEDRIRPVEPEVNPAMAVDLGPRGPSTLNRFSRLPTSSAGPHPPYHPGPPQTPPTSEFTASALAPASMGLGPSPVTRPEKEAVNTSVPFPRKPHGPSLG
eukprot:TRINITY_DN3005_c0_g2_i1.p1 TRINITY_DN3005_c0_g2~~TRINITY_DN3005_c0_g2_i1.p1  ORF type:complete len:1541 (+),score=662.79 TRINITY_DN3005_c0_g2_i1:179-4801(+)